ncbi:MAG: hypothetical protein DBX59_02350 [Bacillota bacterium]|nr:MAG: hypothetical protein DBX59_02350 [Bacillota bacterium]
MNIQKLVDGMSVEELCGQVLAYDVQPKDDFENTIKIIKKIKPGALFLCDFSLAENFDRQEELLAQHNAYVAAANEGSPVPVIVCNDVENGPGSFSNLYEMLPNPMAWAACDDEKLVERAGELTAAISRSLGIHYALAPVVDINYNFRSPIVNIRAASDLPERVIKIMGAYLRGLQKNRYMAGCLKHFPGDGVDDRNQHFLTSVNSLNKEQWDNSFGKVYKTLFDEGAISVMAAHIACPALGGAKDECGYLPATIDKTLISDVLKGELGFRGCVISDAMSMIGTCSRVPLDQLAIRFFQAGGDLLLFPEPDDFDRLVHAVRTGVLPIERMKDAVKRCLLLKESVRLDEEEKVRREIGDIAPYIEELQKISQEIADKSVKTVRNFDGVLPIKPKKGAKVLLLNMLEPFFHKDPTGKELEAFRNYFEEKGYCVTSMDNAKHKQLEKCVGDYDLVIVCLKFSSLDYHGATLRVGWNSVMTLWRGYALQNPNLVFVSFGDPYKLYDFPYARTYINTFSISPSSQRAAAKLILGEIESKAKNPVGLKGFFDRED